MKRRVVITGLGAITPIGNTVEEFWNGIKKWNRRNRSDHKNLIQPNIK